MSLLNNKKGNHQPDNTAKPQDAGNNKRASRKAQRPGASKPRNNRGPANEHGKKSVFNMDLSQLGKTRRAGKPTPEDQWTYRADLMPKSIIALNRDRDIQRIMSFVLAGVVVVAIIVTIGMQVAVGRARGATADAMQEQMSLQRKKAEYKDVEDVLNSLAGTRQSVLATLYAEVDWTDVANNLNSALPPNCSYQSVSLSEYNATTGATGSSSSSGSDQSVWGNNGAIQVQFTVKSGDFISAQTFISSFMQLPGYVTGDISSVSGDADNGYTYTGTLSFKLDPYTTDRSDGSAGADAADRKLLKQLREQLETLAGGNQTESSSSGSGSSGSSSSSSSSSK